MASAFRARGLQVVWYIVVVALFVGIWFTLTDILASQLIAVPPAVAFFVLALLGGRPFAAPPERVWLWSVHRTSREERKEMKLFGRIQFVSLDKVAVPYGELSAGRKFVRKAFRRTALAAAAVCFLGVAAVPLAARHFAAELPPNLDAVLRYDPLVATKVLSVDGEIICSFGYENRTYAPLATIPEHVQKAFIAAEDRRFYEHRGVDPIAIARAFAANYRGGSVKQGGSTITQQVIKQVQLKDSERSYARKIKELLIAVDIERRMSKPQILELYLNHLFLGHDSYGIGAASQNYFGKEVGELTLAEGAMLAGLPKAPSSDSPHRNFERAKRRQAYVLAMLAESGFISEGERRKAEDEEIAIIGQTDPVNRTAAPYVCDLVRREFLHGALRAPFGAKALYGGGLTIKTTVDMRLERQAEASVRLGLLDLERRLGFNGPEGRDTAFVSCDGTGAVIDDRVELAVVSSVGSAAAACIRGNILPLHADDIRRIAEWERTTGQRLALGDQLSVRVETSDESGPDGKTKRYALTARRTGGPEHPEALQAAIVVVDRSTGELKALIGGYDFNESQFNIAVQARRQVGSSVKPYIYLAALMNGAVQADETLIDQPLCYQSASGTWCPNNYVGPHTKDPFRGPVSLRTALALSLNSISVQLLDRTGIDRTFRVLRRLGLDESAVARVLPVAVGAAEFTPWEHTYAYATIAANGSAPPRHGDSPRPGAFISSVTDWRGRTLYERVTVPEGEREQAVPPEFAYEMTWLMQGVVESGTARKVKELGRPSAGKTGTTNDFRDAWFVGYTADLVAGVWVGRMTPSPIGEEETGGRAALPIWLSFMKAAHPPELPAREFPVPSEVVLIPGGLGGLTPYVRGQVPAKRQGSISITIAE